MRITENTDAYENGRKAAKEFRSERSCPYSANIESDYDDYSDWMRGFLDEKEKNEYLHKIARHDAERGVMINEYFEFKDDAHEDGYFVGQEDFENYKKYFKTIQDNLFHQGLAGTIER